MLVAPAKEDNVTAASKLFESVKISFMVGFQACVNIHRRRRADVARFSSFQREALEWRTERPRKIFIHGM